MGSIKPQKNTLGLLRLFAQLRDRFPGSTLRLIGPIQDPVYHTSVQAEIENLNLREQVEFTGYIPPQKLSEATKDAHIHLSASACETFGRSIFETLALGLPNIANATDNAAAEFLDQLPYARFVDSQAQAVQAVEEILADLPKLSSMASEIGLLYDDGPLSQLLLAHIHQSDIIAISDFDGTLFHKHDPEKTRRCIKAFQNYPLRIICTARPIQDLLEQLKTYELDVHWIIGCSGAIVANGAGDTLWTTPLHAQDIARLAQLIPQSTQVKIDDQVLQIAAPATGLPNLVGLRVEVYQGTAFIAHWEASKLRAVHRLLRHIDWSGRIQVYGDGPYDLELLNYFDGTLISPFTFNKRQTHEIVYV